MNSRYTFINDQFVPHQNAGLPVTDLSIQRGYGIFDYLRTYRSIPLFFDDHLERFFVSANEMRLPVNKTKAELKDIIQQLALKNAIPNSGIRITLTGGDSPDGYSIAVPNMIITQHPMEPLSDDVFHKGIKLITFDHQRQLAHVKTTDYLMAVWLQPFIKQKGADDVLYHNNNVVTECPRANVFMVKDDTIITPAANILKGVIRKKIIEIAAKQFKVQEQDITMEELINADEMFITSTTKQVLPVTHLNNTIIHNGKPGKITKELHRSLSDHINSD